MWSHLPRECLTHWQPFDPDQPARLRSGAAVVLVKHGTVAYERSGFARVRWMDGTESVEWATDLKEAA